ncbi:unnamed protein product [Ilex paraguariensis]|uniref:DNA repair protein UVH3 n=1 Tax=Ilex paraguariensis TaxID=185542 RepID=A0ABC8SVU7_9AQUA
MGVHGLWELLAPVGRRVSVETLTGKKLAIDASIWMIQFMKAMRDDKGEMVRNAHILGFFRRICKLLFLRTKPVFVFDGATPALKRRTVIARRRQRENAQAKIRKTAEKLLLNHLKAMRLKELAKDLENQKLKNDATGKNVVNEQRDVAGNTLEGNDMASGSYDPKTPNELLAASLAAEEYETFTGNASTPGGGVPAEEEDGSEDEEMILPMMHGKVDPAVLAALPPSMQLDLLVQMRERLMAENRQKYQKVKKAPARFSELQIQAYLKTVAFRREIDEVQKSAAGRGIGGVQTSRIASEANREFIFSSSFTGDKQVLTSSGVEKNGNEQCQTSVSHPSSDSLGGVAFGKMPNAGTESVGDEPVGVFDGDVETYLDERGRVRVSKVRAMGICMTRDLQRNLDLMKEIEQERIGTKKNANDECALDNDIAGVPKKFPSKMHLLETSYLVNDGAVHLSRRNDVSTSGNGTSMEISFEDESQRKCVDGDDELFARLVAGEPVMNFSADTPLRKQSPESTSDCEWEEGIIEEKVDTITHGDSVESRPSLVDGDGSNESEVEWEDGFYDIPKNASPCPDEYGKTVSKGALEEEADFQEAIRRSLGDLKGQKYIETSFDDETYKDAKEIASEVTNVGFAYQEKDRAEPNEFLENVCEPNDTSCKVMAGFERMDIVCGINISKPDDSSGAQLAPCTGVSDNMEVVIKKPFDSSSMCHPEFPRQNASGSEDSHRVNEQVGSAIPIEEKMLDSIGEQLVDSSSRASMVSYNRSFSGTSQKSNSDVILTDTQQLEFEAAVNDYMSETTEHRESSLKEPTTDINVVEKLVEEKDYDDLSKERYDFVDKTDWIDGKNERGEITEASLEEEFLNLGQERIELGDEQKRLERNAESVSSEMFAECQELLQMFGLPYIIAPMEAEAQCAYMELANLVDGVVTDDSDVFLFGAQSVYKNIFDDRKYVETYLMKDIENELGLTREKLIRMALLLGSDYTEGVSGIGIVNAIEVINAFPEEDGLSYFREWIESPDPTILGKVDLQAGSSSKRRVSKFGEDDVSCSHDNIEGVSASNQHVSQADCIQNMKQIFMDKHRNVSKNWHIPSSFPSEAVTSAYASPQVEKSTEPFSWGKPDLFVLRKLCWEKFGWGAQKADELLLPVLKEYNKHETQLRLEAFYTFNERFAKIRSKRIKKAVKGIMGNDSLKSTDDSLPDVSKGKKKTRPSPREAGGEKSRELEVGIAGDEMDCREISGAKQSRKRRAGGEPLPLEFANSAPTNRAEGKRNTKNGLSVKGRGRGRGRGRSVGRGGRKENSGFECAEANSDDGTNSDSEEELQLENYEGSHEVRRSTRPRKTVNYKLSDLETDGLGKTVMDNGTCTDKEAEEEEAFEDQGMIVGDAVAGPSQKTCHKVGGSPTKEGLSRDYLEAGGGFCIDEAKQNIDNGELGSGHNSDTLSEAELSREYHKMGGGFCLDENEVGKDPNEFSSSPARLNIFENVDPIHHLVVEEAENEIGKLVTSPVRVVLNGCQGGGKTGAPNATTNSVHSNVAISQFNIREADSGTSSVRSLSAMPNLRRKRRNR